MRTKQQLTDAIRQERRAALVVNAHSRRGRRLYDDARSRLIAVGFTLLGTYPVDRPGELQKAIADAVDLGPDLLVAGGGDGTISTAARMLAHRDIALGLLPLRTTNNFARTVGIRPDLDDAITILADGKVIDVDLGLAGDMPFTNHVGIGLSADVMLNAPRPLKRVTGRLAYPITALTFILVYQDVCKTGKDEAAAKRIKAWLQYAEGDGQSVAPQLQYAPLPDAIHTAALAKVKGLLCNGQPL